MKSTMNNKEKVTRKRSGRGKDEVPLTGTLKGMLKGHGNEGLGSLKGTKTSVVNQ